MTAFDYGRSKASADRMIARYGQAGTLRRPTTSGTAYDPTQGPPNDQSVSYVIFDYSAREIDGTRILATDKKALVARGNLSIDPTPKDKLVEADGKAYNIVDVRPLKPAGTVVLYEMQVRR